MLGFTIGFPPLSVFCLQLMLTMGPWKAELNIASVNRTNPPVSDAETFGSRIPVPAKIPFDQKLCCFHPQIMAPSV